MPREHWHLAITLESSAKEQIKELAAAERRSASNFVAVLVERALARELEKRPT